ncbi:MAG TPA: orotidine-5'-phosphate decarboxylase [Candidatus Thermoplasmatota archaeon]|nr:orotidine-5'-phosphate decarboxylase [Candidatus Thermoplasmatota archaeon]
MPASFRTRLHEAARKNDSWVCVGLDPDPERLPKAASAAQEMETFLLDIVDRTKDAVCCYKPNSAFFEAIGPGGHEALTNVVAHARRFAPVILDGKRGDIGNTAKAYAAWAYDRLEADAITANAFMGRDAVEPFFARAEKGVFVLARTSNPGAADLQSLRLSTGELVYEHVVSLARQWNHHNNVGLVAGATAPDELRRIRHLAGPEMLLLIPGVGAQGGSAEHAIRFGANPHGDNAIVNSSRGILYAPDPAQAARALRDELNKHRAR